MSKPNFVHIEESEFELAINADNISYVQRLGDSVFVHFNGGENPLHLRMKPGQAIWGLVRASSTTIYQASPNDKNAGTHSS